MNDFITWWFTEHYIASTLITPFLTWMYMIWSDGNTTRMMIASTWSGTIFIQLLGVIIKVFKEE